ncbi:hypothetical protein [Jiulongibacter sediminis]|uniref:hypothetical protein n=1 Tax=Jiulongibacter sediminis TaxID=1605367 RepID=UPI0006DBE78B|nr:hypothetical protein [Jiulongibacter sediminis]
MIYHILNGDALTPTFRETGLKGEVIIAREALMDGDLSGETWQAFLENRARVHGVSPEEYQKNSGAEFDKIRNAPEDSVFHLWFEYDLFCQVNFWFFLSLIYVLPENRKVWAYLQIQLLQVTS